MPLWANGQAVSASATNSITTTTYRCDDFKKINAKTSSSSFVTNEWYSLSVNDRLCKYFSDKTILRRMKYRKSARIYMNTDKSSNEPIRIKSSKNLHERQVRSLERYNKFTKKYNDGQNSFKNIEKKGDNFIRNISHEVGQRNIMNNGTVTLENTTLISREPDDEGNGQKQASDKIPFNVNGSLKLVFALLTVLGILISIASIIYCFWTTRRSASGLVQVQRRLSDNENNHLNQSLPNFEALMLSVQNLGCAGMERLGIPASTAMGAPHSSQRDDSRSIRRSTFPTQHDLIISANRKTQNLLEESKTEPKLGINSEAYESYKRCNLYTSCSLNTNCPPHIHRHDGEFGRDRICNSLSQHNAEIKRSYIQAPPNKSIQDVPDATQSLHTSYYRQLNSHRQPNRSEKMKIQDAFDVSQPFQNSNKKMGEKVKGFFMKIIDNGSSGSGSQKIANSENKVHNNTSTTHRSTYIASSESSNGLKDDSNELLLNGSTNLHSKSYDSNNSLLLGTASKTSLKPSSSSSSSLSSGPSPDHHNCL